MDNYRLIELVFGAITSIGILYALLSPTVRKLSRKRRIKQIIKQEIDDNHETISAHLFRGDLENVDENSMTIGDLELCCTELRDKCWKMLRTEMSGLFNPRVFVTINSYYYQVESIIDIASRLKNQGLVDDERKIKLKDHISYLEFYYVFGVALDVIVGFKDIYQAMLKKDRDYYSKRSRKLHQADKLEEAAK